MRYLFTGTGRCGTATLARALTAAGLPTTHEALYQPFRVVYDWEHDTINSECSWVAQWFLVRDKLPGDAEIFHVVRDPCAVYSSFMARDYFTDMHRLHPSQPRWWYCKTMIDIDDELDEPSAAGPLCSRWILGTHERLSQYPKVYIDRGNPLARIASLGVNVPDVTAPLHRTNEGPRSAPNFTIPPEIEQLAKELGYK